MVVAAPEAPSLERLPERMKAARKADGNITQLDLAKKLQVSVQIVRAWEQAVNHPHGLYAQAVGYWLDRVESLHPFPPESAQADTTPDPAIPQVCGNGHQGRMAWQGDRFRCRECDKISRQARRAAGRK
jgi:transcriptional regulator with XRE-family HTH domain